MRKRYTSAYDRQYAIFSRKVERYLVAIVSALLAMMLAAQVALQFPGIRHAVTPVDSLEGVPYEPHVRDGR